MKLLENVLYNLKVLRYQLSGAYFSSHNGVADLEKPVLLFLSVYFQIIDL